MANMSWKLDQTCISMSSIKFQKIYGNFSKLAEFWPKNSFLRCNFETFFFKGYCIRVFKQGIFKKKPRSTIHFETVFQINDSGQQNNLWPHKIFPAFKNAQIWLKISILVAYYVFNKIMYRFWMILNFATLWALKVAKRAKFRQNWLKMIKNSHQL